MSDVTGQTTLAVIPARGGSKRISRKNIKPFLGIPLLIRTIELLEAAEIFDDVVVSTDDDEISALAISAGAQVPFRRPAELASDTAATLPVIEHAVRSMDEREVRADFVCCVYPTAVLAQPADFRSALSTLRQSGLDYVFTATSFPYPIQRALRQSADGSCEMFWPEHRQSRSQDLEPAFHDAGQLYFGCRDAWLERRPLFGPNSRMLLIPRYRVQDIDTPEDWERAEFIFEMLQRDSR